MYQSILKKRTRDVRREDFDVAPHFHFGRPFHSAATDRDISLWNKIFPYFPRQIYGLFADSFETDVSVKFVLDQAESISIQITSRGLKKFGVTTYFYPNDIDMPSNGTIEVVPEFQGKGIGKKYLRARTEFNVAMGVPCNKFTAELGNGGYTWARAGAHLDFDEWRTSYPTRQKFLSQRLIMRLESIKDQIDPGVFLFAKALCRVVAKNDLARLAQIRERLHVPEKTDWKSISQSAIGENIRSFFSVHSDGFDSPNDRANHECMALCRVFEGAVLRNTDVTVPAYLLSGTSWPAIIDYSNISQMHDIGEYVGGWKTIVPVRELVGVH